MEIIEEIGSFIIHGNTCSAGSVFFVEYKKEHVDIYKWQFINDLEKAKLFAKKKTRADKKLFAEVTP